MTHSTKRSPSSLKKTYSTEAVAPLNWEHLVAAIALQIRQSLDLTTILQVVVKEVQQLLGCDRVLIYQFAPDNSGRVVVEAISAPQWSLLDQVVQDSCFEACWLQPYNEGMVRAIANVATANLTPCHADFLAGFSVKANLVVPVLCESRLWGLLIAHSCTAPRPWPTEEIEGLQHIAVHMGIAIHQAELVAQLQAAKAELEVQVSARTQDLEQTNQHLAAQVAENQAMVETLRQSRNDQFRLAAIVASSDEAIIGKTPDGVITSWNQAAERLFGYSAAEVVGHHIALLIPPDRQTEATAILQRIKIGEQVETYETQRRHKDGSLVDVALTISPIRDETGRVIGASKIARDIHEQQVARRERKRLEAERQQAALELRQSNAQLEDFFDNASDLIQSVSLQDGRFLYVNRTWLSTLGYERDDIAALTIFDLLASDCLTHCQSMFQSLQAGTVQQLERLEVTLVSKTGQNILLEGSINVRCEAGIPVATRAIFRDVTAQRQAEQALQEQTTLLRIFYEISPLLLGVVELSDDDMLHTFHNPMTLQFFGVEAAALDNQWASAIGVPPAHIQRWLRHYRQSQEQQQPVQFEYEHVTESGTHWLSAVVAHIGTASSGRPQFSYMVTDITERKQLEAEHQRTEELERRAAHISHELKLLENILDIILAGYWDWDIAGNQEYLSPGFKSMFGYADHELENSPETWQQLIFPEDLASVFACFDQHVKSHGDIPYYNEVRYRHKDGSTVWVVCSGKVIEWGADGQPIRMIGCHIDVTDRKQAEAELRESQMTSQAILLAIPDLLLRVTRDGTCHHCLPPADFRAGLFLPVQQHLSEILPPDLLQSQLEAIEQALATGTLQIWEQEIFKYAQTYYEEIRIVPCGDDECLVIVRDITERKKTELALYKSEATNRALISAIPDFLVRMRQDGLQMQVINRGAIHVLQKDDDDNYWVTEIMPEAIAQERIELAQKAIKTGQPQQQEYQFTVDGEIFYEEARIAPIWDDEVLVVVRDISDRKQIEIELKALSDRLALALKAGKIGTWDWDLVGDCLVWDDRMYEIHGVAPSDFAGAHQAWEACVHPEDLLACQIAEQQALAGEQDFDSEFRVVWPNGSIRVIKAYALVQRDDQGQPLRMIGINYDITDIKQSELDLKWAKDQLELVLQASSEGFWDWDLITGDIYFSPQWKAMLGYADHELENSPEMWKSLIFEEDLTKALQLIENYNSGRTPDFTATQRFHHKDGSVVHILSRAIHLNDEQGKAVRMVGSHLDITQTVTMQTALKTSEMQLSGILNSSLDGIMAFRSVRDGQGIIVDFEWLLSNPTSCKIIGRRVGDIIGKRLLEELPGNREDGLFDLYVQVVESGEPMQREFYYNHDGIDGWFENIAVQLGDGFAVTFRDITAIKKSELTLQQTNQQLSDRIGELDQRHGEILSLSEISDFLQACSTVEEACNTIVNLVESLFPHCSGGIFTTSASRNRLEMVARWGTQLHSHSDFEPHSCWGLRRGRMHWVGQDRLSLRCKHISEDGAIAATLCIPMMAQGETLGLFYLSTETPEALPEAKQQLARTLAEQVGMAIANLKLQETLKHQSIRDPLTGLYNRRYLEESLTQEMLRAQRKQHSIGVIMIDIDHFKRFNDTYGHDMGDAVLKLVGTLLKDNVRDSDIACRYGGEEMILFLPEANLNETAARAEKIRVAVNQLQLSQNSQLIDSITASFGVACFPLHGSTGPTLIKSADAALYRAKEAGRNQVILAL